MRADLIWDVYEEEGRESLFEEVAPHAIAEFTKERLHSYYLSFPQLAFPALSALEYARQLETEFPLASLVFAATAIEVTTKDVLLKPIVFGLVHNGELAKFISDLSASHTRGMDPFRDFLIGVFEQFAGIDLRTFRRDGAHDILFKELRDLHDARNRVVHSANMNDGILAQRALAVASTLLNVLFPKLLEGIGLHLHDPITVCAQVHIAIPIPIKVS